MINRISFSIKILLVLTALLESVNCYSNNNSLEYRSYSVENIQSKNKSESTNTLNVLISHSLIKQTSHISTYQDDKAPDLKFIEKWHAITDGQLYNGTDTVESKIVVYAGQEASIDVVRKVCKYLGANNLKNCKEKWSFNATPEELNFAVCGDLSFSNNYDLGESNIYDICIAQSRKGSINTWWIASKYGYREPDCIYGVDTYKLENSIYGLGNPFYYGSYVHKSDMNTDTIQILRADVSGTLCEV